MAGRGIIDAEIRRRLEPGQQHGRLLRVETGEGFGQDAVELASGNSDAVIAPLLQQRWLRDVGMVVLVQDRADQGGAEVTARQHVGRQRCQHRPPGGQREARP